MRFQNTKIEEIKAQYGAKDPETEVRLNALVILAKTHIDESLVDLVQTLLGDIYSGVVPGRDYDHPAVQISHTLSNALISTLIRLHMSDCVNYYHYEPSPELAQNLLAEILNSLTHFHKDSQAEAAEHC